MSNTVEISKTTNGKLPRLPFERIKNTALSPKYKLSLVFAGSKRMRNLNRSYRKKDYTPNILSFPLSRLEGEMFINPDRVSIEAKLYGMNKRKYIAYLFIHGLLHLKGMAHGATMDRKEREVLRHFNIK